MQAARRAEPVGVPQKKYYNRSAAPRLRAVPAYDAPRRGESRTQKAAVPSHKAAWAQTTALVFCCLAIGATIVAGYERLTDVSLDISRLRREINAAEKRIDKLDVQIACAVDVAHVMDVAVNQMEMDYPKEDQIVDIEGETSLAPVRAAVSQTPSQPSSKWALASEDTQEDGNASPQDGIGQKDQKPEQQEPTADPKQGQQDEKPGQDAPYAPAYAAVAVRTADEQDDKPPSSQNLILAQQPQ